MASKNIKQHYTLKMCNMICIYGTRTGQNTDEQVHGIQTQTKDKISVQNNFIILSQNIK